MHNENWVPSGISELEPNADSVVRSRGNCLVVAGPGAGKTELLAQRADFLFRSNRCPRPKRIIAISFKRDAAQTLRDRVCERTAQHADRFDSFTLDAFAKHLVDRFLLAIPGQWRPMLPYQVAKKGPPAACAREWLLATSLPAGIERPDINSWDTDKIQRVMDLVMHGAELPHPNSSQHPTIQAWSVQWWHEQLHSRSKTSSLTFPMLSRLAAYLLRCNPKIVAALRCTYGYAFLDEFQDTTASQWDLIRTAFGKSETVLTAVGDGKQRIMVWAGAKTDVFERFEEDFRAKRVQLARNYRSVSELVRMQLIIARTLEAESIEMVPASTGKGTGTCQLLEFASPEQEAKYLACLISEEIESGKATTQDFCVLVRQGVPDMVTLLAQELSERNIVLRDESLLQGLRSEPLTGVVLAALRVGTTVRDARAWECLIKELTFLSGLDLERDALAVDRLALEHKLCIIDAISSGLGIESIPSRIVQLVGEGRYRSTYWQYAGGDHLQETMADLSKALQASLTAVGGDFALIPKNIAGEDILPAMTIHKSKGMEFRTVILLGLEDAQWWGIKKRPDEEKRTFFVAFSRAKERVLFTWSDKRSGKFGLTTQRRNDTEALYQVLAQAGVSIIDARY